MGIMSNTLLLAAERISAAGNVVTVNAGLRVQIEPVQAGSGDPSPSNPRAISGWTGATIGRSGINLWDEQWVNGYWNAATGALVLAPTATTLASSHKLRVDSGSTLKIKLPTNLYMVVFKFARDGTFTRHTVQTTIAIGEEDVEWIAFHIASYGNNVYNHDVSINYPSNYTGYYAYNGETVSVSWQSEAGTVYGGYLDMFTGKLYAYPYYASYAGETLVGPWVSSMDVYAPNTTPTTGAQVVDMGGAVTEYSVTPTALPLLDVNNIWADCGPVKLTLSK